jgi:uncharacterized protein
MKTIIGVLTGIFLSLPLLGQQAQLLPLIEVEGYAERKITPDEAIFSISLEERGIKVNDAVSALNKKTQKLADILKKEKIKDYKLVADNYAVDVNRIYRGGTSKDSGYVARQNLRITTSSTNEDLQKIVDAIQKSGDMSYNLHFDVADITRKSLENTLLVDALKDAESRALLIATTLNLKNIRVFHVTVEPNLRPQPMYLMNARAAVPESGDLLIQTDDQTITKKVFVKYSY